MTANLTREGNGPTCAHCGRAIYGSPDTKHGGGWIYLSPHREHCADGRTLAEPERVH